MANINENYNGLTRLKDWWGVVKGNFSALNNELVSHQHESGDAAVKLGNGAVSRNYSAVVGEGAYGDGNSAALGFLAFAANEGTAAGSMTNGANDGAGSLRWFDNYVVSTQKIGLASFT